ncbi:sensor histidine kinase [Paenibacillus sp. WST5]|uniref:Sensor histidine kinase n=2 Tax=Paenibacillus sedimenti TaxID=2770274 RepID=A0A926QK82_9BACL|nr:sensor histidine kinase [Paenibacillus sedimenti]
MSLTRNVEMYLDDLERLTITPYLNDDVMTGLKLKASVRPDDASEYAKFMAEKAFRQTLPRQLKNTRKDILGTILLPLDGSVYIITSVDRSDPVPGFNYKIQPWYQKAVLQDGGVAYISKHTQNYLQLDVPKEVFSVSRLLKDPDSGKPLGVIMTDAANIVLERIVSDVKFNVTAITAILDENYQPLYSNHSLTGDMMKQLAAGKSHVKGDNDSYRVVTEKLQKSGWTIAVLFSDSEFRSQLNWIYWLGTIFAAGGTLVTLFLNLSLTQWIVRPFREMVHFMKSVQRGHLDSHLEIRGGDEIAQLGMTLNTMIAQLKEMIDREYRAVLGQRNAEYRALQSQIQPHFLYNTLTSFIGLNRSGQSRLLEQAILSLSGMLRYMLEHRDTVTLGEETDFIRRYGELQRMRFGDKLQLKIEVDESARNLHLPKLLLQPLVENAIIHGIEPMKQGGTLCIRAEREVTVDGAGAWVSIRIEDDGVGFQPGSQGNSVGLKNVRERLQIFCPSAAFTLESGPGEGTVATLRIPDDK